MRPSCPRWLRLAELARCGLGWALCLTLPACGDGDAPVESCERPGDPGCAAAPTITAEVGFVELAAHEYTILGQPLSASAARIFYDFQPAESDPAAAPLLVLGAGGPSASSMFLLGWNLGPYAIVEGGPAGTVAPNSHRFTDLGNLLYFDARNAGFSYQWLDDPEPSLQRSNAFTVRDYNVWLDGAELLRGLLSFLEDHPALEHAPIYFLAESYGALRATVALNLLLFHAEYASGGREFRAPDLEAAVEHFVDTRVGSNGGTPEQLADWFRGQIFIQPFVAGNRQKQMAGALYEEPGSVLEQLGAEVGVPFVPCREQSEPCDPYSNAHTFLADIGRSRYDRRAPSNWLDQNSDLVSGAATRRAALRRLLGVDAQQLDAAFAGRGQGAYRYGEISYSEGQRRGDLELAFGPLEPWDAYFVAINEEALRASLAEDVVALQADSNQAGFFPRLLENLTYTSTFITRAEYDLSVYSPAWIDTFQSYPEVVRAELVTEGTSELLQVELRDGSIHSLVSPRYRESGHSVGRDEPEALHRDVARFLERTRE